MEPSALEGVTPGTAAAIVAAFGAAATILGAWLGRRSTVTSDTTTHSQSQAVAVDVDKLVELAIAGYREEVGRLQDRVRKLEDQVHLNRNREMEDAAAIAKLRHQVDTLAREVDLLRQWVRAQGADPELVVAELADGYVSPDDDP